MANFIKHQGIVENISGRHLQVRILQTSACAACHAKGHCSASEAKEKLIDATTHQPDSFHPGDRVWVTGTLSMGMQAVVLAFVVPFLLVVFSLFVLMAVWGDELGASLCSLALLIPYYIGLRLSGGRLAKRFSFFVEPMDGYGPMSHEH